VKTSVQVSGEAVNESAAAGTSTDSDLHYHDDAAAAALEGDFFSDVQAVDEAQQHMYTFLFILVSTHC